MKDRSDIENRYQQFCYLMLPGQPRIAHMGTGYLMADLHAALVETEAERDRIHEQAREQFEVAADRIERLENERDRLREELQKVATDLEGWSARSRPDFDRLGAALAPVRRKRPTGEPTCSDGEAVEELVARYNQLREALEWYAETVGGVNRKGKEGDEARHTLAQDMGKRASAALQEAGG